MNERLPPKWASWLLRHGTSAYHRESFEGDLIELYRQGRSRAWYWRQVAAALASAQGRFVRELPWSALGRAVLMLIRAAKSRQTHATLKALMLIFGMIALGVGTLTWANSVRSEACRAAAPVCPSE